MRQKNTEERPVVHYIKDDSEDTLKDEYGSELFETAIRNPFAGKIKKQITIRLDADTIDYFKDQAEETGIPYQTLINYCLADYVRNKKSPRLVFD